MRSYNSDGLLGALALQLAYVVASSEGVATCFACGRFYTWSATACPAADRFALTVACGQRGERRNERLGREAHALTTAPVPDACNDNQRHPRHHQLDDAVGAAPRAMRMPISLRRRATALPAC
jgi:hypothetical protein